MGKRICLKVLRSINLKVAVSHWLINDVAIKDVTAEMLMIESDDPREVESGRRTKRKDKGSVGILCDNSIVRLIAIKTWLDVIRDDCTDNVLVALENNTVAGPVF